MKILMVCIGNICRSPIAEGVLRHKVSRLGLDWTVHSAATQSYHIGEPPHRFSQKVCKQFGIDISGQRARQFCKDDFQQYDRIYAMATDVLDQIRSRFGPVADTPKLSLFLDELNPGANASVPDPWYGEEDGYLPVYEMINETCDKILNRYRDDR